MSWDDIFSAFDNLKKSTIEESVFGSVYVIDHLWFIYLLRLSLLKKKWSKKALYLMVVHDQKAKELQIEI